ncbi:N-acetylglucosamine kinase [Streptomyces sp. NPDC059740]|uniref:N-acetylglucosamine kinase n=1 Tax=Streptomyces sp. NPDC059740 TaxID=3346926 RepID=UPI00366791AF
MGLTPTAPGGVLLAVDAGNSKTDVIALSPDGTVLGSARGGGFHPPQVGVAAAVDVLAPLVASVAEQAGLDGPAEHLSAFLANVDLPVEEAALAEALTARGWARTLEVGNDTFALLRAGLPDGVPPAGVAVVCGAGTNCAGTAPDGRVARFPSIGAISGDWGGGSHLAREAIWHAARAEDGRGEPTVLAETVPAHFGLATMPELIEALHLGRIPATARHGLAPVLFAAAAGGDPVARSLVARQAEEIVVMATVALRRLDLLDEPVRVVLGGGVLAARHPLLHDQVTALLAERAPRAVPHVVVAPPVLGAALRALDHAAAGTGAAAGAAACERLRAHYAATGTATAA